MNSLHFIVTAIGVALAIYRLRNKIADIDFDRATDFAWTIPIVAALLPLSLFGIAWVFDAFNLELLSPLTGTFATVIGLIVTPAVGFAGIVILLLNYRSGQISFRERHIRLTTIFVCLDLLPAVPVITFIVRVTVYGLFPEL